MTALVRRAVRRMLSVAVVLSALGAYAASAQAPGSPGQPARAPAQKLGDVTRGEATFAAKQCTRCHRPGDARGIGPALEHLRRRQGAWGLAGRMWNHAPAMFSTVGQQGIPWPEFSAAEMADLMAYLEADPALDPRPDPGRGLTTLMAKGCLKCHAYRGEGGRIGPDLFERRDEFVSPPDFAARMWRHTPRMATVAVERGVLYPRFRGDEMAQLVGYLRTGGF